MGILLVVGAATIDVTRVRLALSGQKFALGCHKAHSMRVGGFHWQTPVMEQDETAARKLTAVPTASGLAARVAARHLERAGIDPAPLLSKAGLSSAALADHKRITANSQIQFLELVSRAVKDDWIGITLAADFDLRELGMLYYVAASSHYLGDALKRLERYARLGNEALVMRLKKGTACSIELSYTGVPRYLDRHQIEAFALMYLRLCRQLAGQKLVPSTARFVHHRSGDLRPIRQQLGCDVEFDAYADELIFDGATMALPLVGDDPYLNELMVKDCEDAIAERGSNVSPFRTMVENTIAPLLPHADAQAKTVARRLGLSERTFARRLTAEGLSFAEILDQLRRDLAVRYLEEDLQASQIAWLLGFQQLSSFSHACRRWTGKSPSEFRRARMPSLSLA
jgi:AraC-like DNA-binding protein